MSVPITTYPGPRLCVWQFMAHAEAEEHNKSTGRVRIRVCQIQSLFLAFLALSIFIGWIYIIRMLRYETRNIRNTLNIHYSSPSFNKNSVYKSWRELSLSPLPSPTLSQCVCVHPIGYTFFFFLFSSSRTFHSLSQ